MRLIVSDDLARERSKWSRSVRMQLLPLRSSLKDESTDWLAPSMQIAGSVVPVPPALETLPARVSHGGHAVALIGLMNRGKSVLFNQLLGSEASPTSALPETSILISGSSGRPGALALQADGTPYPLPAHPEELTGLLARERNTHLARVEITGQFRLPDKINLIDTPGTMEGAAGNLAAHLDDLWRQSGAGGAVVVVALPAGFARTDRELLEEAARVFNGRVIVAVKTTTKDSGETELAELTEHVRSLVSPIQVVSVPDRAPLGGWKEDPFWSPLEDAIANLHRHSAAALNGEILRAQLFIEDSAQALVDRQRAVKPEHLSDVRECLLLAHEQVKMANAWERQQRSLEELERQVLADNERAGQLNAEFARILPDVEAAVQRLNQSGFWDTELTLAGLVDWATGAARRRHCAALGLQIRRLIPIAQAGGPDAQAWFLEFVVPNEVWDALGISSNERSGTTQPVFEKRYSEYTALWEKQQRFSNQISEIEEKRQLLRQTLAESIDRRIDDSYSEVTLLANLLGMALALARPPDEGSTRGEISDQEMEIRVEALVERGIQLTHWLDAVEADPTHQRNLAVLTLHAAAYYLAAVKPERAGYWIRYSEDIIVALKAKAIDLDDTFADLTLWCDELSSRIAGIQRRSHAPCETSVDRTGVEQRGLQYGGGLSDLTSDNSVIPLYLLCEESEKTGSNGGVSAINDALPELYAALRDQPLLPARIHLSVIAFSDEAEVLLALTEPSNIVEFPGLTPGSSCNLGPALALASKTIELDVERLTQAGIVIETPLVVLLLGSHPQDRWENALAALCNSRSRPVVGAYGFDEADDALLATITDLRIVASQGLSLPIVIHRLIENHLLGPQR